MEIYGMSTATNSTIENIYLNLLEQTRLYKESFERDDDFAVKREILRNVRALEEKLANLRNELKSEDGDKS